MSEPKFTRGCNTRCYWYRPSETNDEETFLIDGIVIPEKMVRPSLEDSYEAEPEVRSVVTAYRLTPKETWEPVDIEDFNEDEVESMEISLSEEFWNSHDGISYGEEPEENYERY
jgi:hypothetical protein